jgi:hypothetical protein
LTTRILTSRLHGTGARGVLREEKLPASQQDENQRAADRTWKTTLDTIKLLGFAQVVLIFCAGAIPSPLRLLAFLPAFALAGASVFQAVWFAVDAFERPRTQTTEQAPSFDSPTAPAHGEEQVLSMPRTA